MGESDLNSPGWAVLEQRRLAHALSECELRIEILEAQRERAARQRAAANKDLDKAAKALYRIAGSRSWRLGRGLARIAGGSLRRHRRSSELDAAIRRVEAARLSLTGLDPASPDDGRLAR
jgi:hypothetical protein